LQSTGSLKVKLANNFELFLGAKAVPITYFVIYCYLGMILQMVPAHDSDPNGASKVKTQVRGFLRLQTQNVPLTKLQKAVPPVADSSLLPPRHMGSVA
jgi:hypothetical protein